MKNNKSELVEKEAKKLTTALIKKIVQKASRLEDVIREKPTDNFIFHQIKGDLIDGVISNLIDWNMAEKK